jgi:hypothetical protein
MLSVGIPQILYKEGTKKNMEHDQIKTSINLLTEVACCTIDVHGEATEGFQICEKAVGYLTKDNTKLLENFKKEIKKAKNLKDNKSYVMKGYAEKLDDIRMVIALLKNLAKAHDAPAEMLNSASDMVMDFYDVDIRGSIHFITEQACYLIQAQGKEPSGKAAEDLEICKNTMHFLTKGDPDLMQAFNERIEAVNHDPDADYNTDEYDGKKTDIRNAVAELTSHAKDPETTTEQSEMLNQAAEMIAVFYGMDDILPNAA